MKVWKRWAVRPVLFALLVCLCASAFAGEAAEPVKPWTFAAVADNRRSFERAKGAYEGVLAEIRDMKANPKPPFPAIEFVIGGGDVNTAADDHANWTLWLDTFKNAKVKPGFYPVIGNWDGGDAAFNAKVILPAQKGIGANPDEQRDGEDQNPRAINPEKYYFDWKNARVIVSRDAKYVEKLIESAPKTIEHVFIVDHYPIFPRHAHVQETSRGDIEFWKMLVKHKDIVRAYFCGHTHYYSRMRVADPAGPAKDEKSFPDDEGGVYQVDCGNAGRSSHGQEATTIVEVLIDGKAVTFRALEAPNDRPTEFRLADEWKIGGAAAKSDQ